MRRPSSCPLLPAVLALAGTLLAPLLPPARAAVPEDDEQAVAELLDAARALGRAGRWAQAERLLASAIDEALALDPDFALPLLLDGGRQARQAGDGDLAGRALGAAWERVPSRPPADAVVQALRHERAWLLLERAAGQDEGADAAAAALDLLSERARLACEADRGEAAACWRARVDLVIARALKGRDDPQVAPALVDELADVLAEMEAAGVSPSDATRSDTVVWLAWIGARTADPRLPGFVDEVAARARAPQAPSGEDPWARLRRSKIAIAVLATQGRRDEVVALAERTLAEVSGAVPPEHAWTDDVLLLAFLVRDNDANDHAGALAVHERYVQALARRHGPDAPEVLAAELRRVVPLTGLGRLQEAEALLRELRPRCRLTPTDEVLEKLHTAALLHASLRFEQHDDLDGALACAAEHEEDSAAWLPDDQLGLAEFRAGHASLALRGGELALAERQARRALPVVATHPDASSFALPVAREALAGVSLATGDVATARRIIEEILADPRSAAEDLDNARFNEVVLLLAEQRPGAALERLPEVLPALAKRHGLVLPPGLLEFGGDGAGQGRFAQALGLVRPLTEAMAHFSPQGSLQRTLARAQAAALDLQLERPERACEQFDALVREQRARHGDDDALVLRLQEFHVQALALAGRLDEGIDLARHVLASRRRLLSADDCRIASIRVALAELLTRAPGRSREARHVLEDLLAEGLPAGAEFLEPFALNNLATARLADGDAAGAAVLLEDLLARLETRSDLDPAVPASALLNQAAALRQLGRSDEARVLRDEALQRLDGGAPESLLVTAHLNALGVDLEDARPTDALARVAEVRAAFPELTAQARARLHCIEAFATWLAGEPAAALAVLEREVPGAVPRDHAARLELPSLRAWLLADLQAPADETLAAVRGCADAIAAEIEAGLLLSTREAFARAVSLGGWIDELSSFARLLHEDELVHRAFEAVEALRAVAAGTAGAWIARAADPGVAAARDELSRLSLRLEATGPSATPATLDALARQRDRVEADLRRGLAEAGAVPPRVTAQALAGVLAPGEAAVSYRAARLQRIDRSSPRRLVDETRLLAWVVTHDGALASVDLGPADETRQLVQRWRERLDVGRGRGVPVGGSARRVAAHAADELAALGDALRRAVLDPVLALAPDSERLHVVLDDALLLLPLDALPAADGGCVGDHVRLLPASSLSRLLEPPRAPAGEPSLLLLGDVAFGAAGSGEGSRFSPLPGTAEEVIALSTLFEEHVGGRLVRLTGGGAAAPALQAALPGTRWVHLATHGWFDELSREGAGAAGAFGFGAQQTGATAVLAPWTLCGLALAGAEAPRLPDGRAPGLLTAEALASFDLSACELAVLSACETSVGVHSPGLGLRSLQSALEAAGARATLTSLWKVDDAATRRLMETFYRRLWVEGDDAPSALWHAKRVLREEGAAVWQWAAWVLTGG